MLPLFKVIHSRMSSQSGLTSAKAPSQHSSGYAIPDLTDHRPSLGATIVAAWEAALSHFAAICRCRNFHSKVCPMLFACQALGSVIALSRAVNKTPLTTTFCRDLHLPQIDLFSTLLQQQRAFLAHLHSSCLTQVRPRTLALHLHL